MALQFAEGFDDFVTVADYATTAAYVGTVGGGIAVAPVVGRGGSGKAASCMNNDAGGGVLHQAFVWQFAGATTVIVGFAFTNNNQGVIEVALQSGTTRLAAVKQTGVAGISFYDSTNLLGFDTVTGLLGSVPFRNWSSYIEVSLTAGNPGSLTVRVDGVVVFTSPAGNFGSGVCNAVGFGSGASYLQSVLIDDLYVCDSTGATCNTFLGDTRVLSVAPTGDGSELQWTPSVAGAHFALVDESPLDYDASYVSASTPGSSDTYTFPATAVAAGSVIAAVQLRVYAKSDSGGTDTVQGIARVGGTDYLAPAFPGGVVHAVYTGIDNIFEVNPATGMAWAAADINVAEFGVKNTAGVASGTCSTAMQGDPPIGQVTWLTGDKFTGFVAGGTITIAGAPYSIVSVFSPTVLYVAASVGVNANVAFNVTF